MKCLESEVQPDIRDLCVSHGGKKEEVLVPSITAAQPRSFVFLFRSRTIGTNRVHVADEDIWMLVIVYNRVYKQTQ
jgi:hypothetical protein